jgi:hypothetical protein
MGAFVQPPTRCGGVAVEAPDGFSEDRMVISHGQDERR